jgi:CRP-like cAMP-binding protein
LPIFRALPAPALGGLARSLEPVRLAAGEVLIREGEPGDRFYAVAGGRLQVTIGGIPIATNLRGDGIGEIALLYGVPRTATVTAASPATVFALSREDFLCAVTGHTPTARAATAIADERLAQDRPYQPSTPEDPQPNSASP